jgi:N-acetylglucosamine malate deacetylase 2
VGRTVASHIQLVPPDVALFPAVMVAAHPDDEVIGLGASLAEFRELRAIVHVTDGAPRSGPDIQNAGESTWWEYAQLRQFELDKALGMAGIKTPRYCLWCPDQKSSFWIAEIATQLAGIFKTLCPSAVFTHAYEGGHPDHDAVCASVHYAVALLEANYGSGPKVFEFASYYAGRGGMETECFLEQAGYVTQERVLTDKQIAMKRTLLSCYESQKSTLANFPVRREPIRVSPCYDFSMPPHTGKLFYENFPWGVIGSEWRGLASQAREKLGLSSN